MMEKNQKDSRLILLLVKSASVMQSFIEFGPPVFVWKNTSTSFTSSHGDNINWDKAFSSSLEYETWIYAKCLLLE